MRFPHQIVVEWSEVDGVYIARVPALPNCAAHGDTPAEAVTEAQAAAEMMVEELDALAKRSVW